MCISKKLRRNHVSVILSYRLLRKLRGWPGTKPSGVRFEQHLMALTHIHGQTAARPRSCCLEVWCLPCLPDSGAGRNCSSHLRSFSWLGYSRLSSPWIQQKLVIRDEVSVSLPLWTLTCFIQSVAKAPVASSKVFKLILTSLQTLTRYSCWEHQTCSLENEKLCILAILWAICLKIEDILLHLCLICKDAYYTTYICRI